MEIQPKLQNTIIQCITVIGTSQKTVILNKNYIMCKITECAVVMEVMVW